MGMPAVWIRVAEVIGVDAFLAMWFIVDSEPNFLDPSSGVALRISMRRYSSWLRFQRNRYIEALLAEGLNPRQVQERVHRELCEKISVRHISRIGRRP